VLNSINKEKENKLKTFYALTPQLTFIFDKNFKVETPYVRYELSCIEGAKMIHIAM
jgi:hypothetical protein